MDVSFKTGIELHILYNCNIDYSLPEALYYTVITVNYWLKNI